MKESFGSRLRKLREENEITQTGLAKIFNISPPSISQYEKDIRTPDYELLIKFADYFDVSTDYLLGRTDTRELNKSNDIETLAAHRKDENLDIKNIDDLRALIKEVMNEEK